METTPPGLLIDWTLPKGEMYRIQRIIARAKRYAKHNRIDFDALGAEMDLTATHKYVMPLRLNDMAAGRTEDIMHDIAGIARFLDREALTMGGCFVPRFAATEAQPHD